ncbi:molybdopterin-dependent oxidoreductase [Halalkalirubrum salinum]|uniref:molybdopterin-dependent oxidoreductase n=1 Tax=Halalkalirubrum salinum TaxID=2563889 RepID=UPI0010FADE7A|nr:molybdopterin-dependent oxidoreductase [Halalkalirubrum salinum]
MSQHDTTSTDDDGGRFGFSFGRRDFMKAGAVGAVAASLGTGLSSLQAAAQADDYRDALVEHTGEWRPSNCAGCTSWCSAQILVDDKTNRVLRTRGNEDSKVHGSNDCPRQDLAIQQLYDPDRVKQPMRRTNPEKGKGVDPEFEPISWEEAIGEIADRIMELRENQETEKFMLTRGRYTYLRPIIYNDLPKIIGSPNNISHSAICAEAEKFGPMYTEGEWSYRQYDVTETNYVIAWGADPISTNRQVSHYSNSFGDLLDSATVAVVEPRLSSTATKSDEWLPVKPGYDGALASAMAHVLLRDGLWNREFVGDFADGENRFVPGEQVDPSTFEDSVNSQGVVTWWNEELYDKDPEWAAERAGVPAEQIERVATGFGKAGPQAISWLGGGPVMQVRGSPASMAIHALNGLVGSVGNRGGTLYAPGTATEGLPAPDDYIDDVAKGGLYVDEANEVPREKMDQRGRLEFPALKKGKSGGGVVTNNAADGILQEDPNEVKVLLSYWNNFAFSNPESQRWEEALAKIPFHATIETHASETAWFSDIILPATHHQFERWGQLQSTGQGYRTINLMTPVMADNPDDPRDVLENGRLWDTKSSETEVPYLIAEALAERGFDNMLRFFETEFPDPETGETVREEFPGDDFESRELRAQAFARNAAKIRTQPIWDSDYRNGDYDWPGGEEFDSWVEFRERGIWHTDKWDYRHRWPSEGGEFGTDSGVFEFDGETLQNALQRHADRHDTDINTVLEVCNYQGRVDDSEAPNAFVPHYEEPYNMGDPEEYPLKFVDHKSRLGREGRAHNTTWVYEFNDVNPGDEPDMEVAKINPKDAAELGIENGDDIVIKSPAGENETTAKLWEGVRPGTVAKTWGQGHWAYGTEASEEFGEEPRGSHNNRIIGAEYDRLSGSSVYYGNVQVKIEKR